MLRVFPTAEPEIALFDSPDVETIQQLLDFQFALTECRAEEVVHMSAQQCAQLATLIVRIVQRRHDLGGLQSDGLGLFDYAKVEIPSGVGRAVHGNTCDHVSRFLNLLVRNTFGISRCLEDQQPLKWLPLEVGIRDIGCFDSQT